MNERMIIDIFSEIAGLIRQTGNILINNSLGNNQYQLTIDNLTNIEINDYLLISTFDVLVTDITGNTITVYSENDISLETTYISKKPYFNYEKWDGQNDYNIEKQISSVYRNQLWPLILLLLDVSQEHETNEFNGIRLANTKFYFIIPSKNNEKYADWRKSNIETNLYNLVDYFINQINIHQNILTNRKIKYIQTDKYFLGSDNNQNILTEYCDAIEIIFPELQFINLNYECSNIQIIENVNFSYSQVTAAYSDDIDYNDIIQTQLIATNNTNSQQTCIVYFELNNSGDYARYISIIDAGNNHTFEHTFENIDIFQENIIRVYNLSFVEISSFTIAATPEFEMFFEATNAMKNIQISLATNTNQSIVNWDDSASDVIYSGLETASTLFNHIYATNGIKRITFSNFKEIKYFSIQNQSDTSQHNKITINANEISKLRGCNYLYLYSGTVATSGVKFNINLNDSDLRKLNLKTLQIGSIISCTISENTIKRHKALKQLYLRNQTGIAFSEDELENIFLSGVNLTGIGLTTYNAKDVKIYNLIQKATTNSLCSISSCDCSQLNLTTLEIGNSNNISFNNSKLTSAACDRILYLTTLSNATTGKSVNIAGASNAKRTHASDGWKATLLANGWTVTDNGVE